MDLEAILLSEIRKTNTIWFQLHEETKKQTHKQMIKQKTGSQVETKLLVARGKMMGGWGVSEKGEEKYNQYCDRFAQ